MAGKAPTTLNDAMGDVAQGLARAMGTPEAANPAIQQGLQKLLTVVTQIGRGGAPQGPGGGAAPGAAPMGTPSGAGMGPPGGGAANPTMPSLTGGQLPPTPPGAGATQGAPQVPPDELRRAIAQGVS